MMMAAKAGGVWYEIADHLGHISLLCVWLEKETVEAQLVCWSRLVDSWRDTKTYEKVNEISCARIHQKILLRLFADLRGLKATNRVEALR